MSARSFLAACADRALIGMEGLNAGGILDCLAELEELEAEGWNFVPPFEDDDVTVTYIDIPICGHCGRPLNVTTEEHEDCPQTERYKTVRFIPDTDTAVKQ